MHLAEPSFIETRSSQLFSVYHEPDPGSRLRTPVLVCSPWGWDDAASYRPRRAWAERLAAAGRPALRFDLPGTGNSSGSPRDPGLVTAWLDGVAAAAEELRARTGVTEVAILGLGLGGLLAIAAAEAGAAVGELVMVTAPPSGRAFVRGARNFSRLQGWHADASSVAVPDGWIEASGFVLTAGTIEELEAIEPKGPFGPDLRRVLMLSRRPGARNPLATALEAAGVEVRAEGISGWGQMVAHPETSRLAEDAAEKVASWMDESGAAAPDAAAGDGGGLTGIELDGAPAPITETPFPVEHPYGRSFGLLTTPADGEAAPLCLVFLNAGAVRSTGPNRMWLERARAWAARGLPALRVDLEGIGEADGDPDGVPPGEEFFATKYQDELGRVLDALEARGLGPDFALVGLCSGGFLAFRTALADPRVRAAYVINAGALVWRPGIFDEREVRKVSRVFERKWVGKLLRGEIEWSKVRSMFTSIGERARRRLRPRRRGGTPWDVELQADLDRLEAHQTRLALMFCGNEGMADELEAVGFATTLDSRRFVEMVDLPGADHTLRPLESQAALRRTLDEGLQRELEARGWAPPVESA
ncbi:MAG TPA: alpha/beta fold hydrolase [Solirubrobacterales bacterium]